MTHKWGRLATYPKLGDSQLSLREERPQGETLHSMRVYVPSPNCPYPCSSGARNLGGEIRGRRGLWPFWAKRPKFTQKWSLQKSYPRITRERRLGLLHGCKPELCFPFATGVKVQSIFETFLTPQPLKHTFYGKKCIYRRYWYVHIFGSLRNKQYEQTFLEYAHSRCPQICRLWLDRLRPLMSLVLAYERMCKEAVWHACSQGDII